MTVSIQEKLPKKLPPYIYILSKELDVDTFSFENLFNTSKKFIALYRLNEGCNKYL